MTRKHVTQPLCGAPAFAGKTPEADLSQAAQLLLLGFYIRGDDKVFSARAELMGRRKAVEAVPEKDRARMKVPKVRGDGRRFRRKEVQAGHRHLHRLKSIGPGERHRRINQLAKAFHARPDIGSVVRLLEACLHHRSELVRVAAASTYFDLTTDHKELLAILVKGTRSKDRLILKVAAMALAHVAPGHPRFLKMASPGRGKTRKGTAHTSLLVHGTWARTQPWWQPGGDFHNYILTSVRPDLYSASDRFDWSGGYSDDARAQAGSELASWLASHNAQGADLFTHSHGGSVAMLASHTPSLQLGELVLLSCPVHAPKYLPNFASVRKTVSIRVHLDLVILADRGGQRFSDPQIEEHVLPVWFDHSATHDVTVWQKYDVRSML